MTGLPDPAADPAGYVLAVADLREARAKAVDAGVPWITHDVHGTGYDDEAYAHYYVMAGKFAVAEMWPYEPWPDTEAQTECAVFNDHIAAEANPAHALAEVALWRGVVERHGDAWIEGKAYCRLHKSTKCPDLAAVVAACQAYAGGQ